MRRHSLVAWALVAYSSFSYSDFISEQSGNAAANGQTWIMTNILPAETGLVVNGVIYRYTTEKNTADDMVVNIQNQNALGAGYIFRQSDDWSGLPQNTITNSIPINSIPGEYWGPGEIQVEGNGLVTDPLVVYSYRYRDCTNPILDPECPQIFNEDAIMNANIEIYNPLDNPYVQDALDNETELREEDEEFAEEEDEEDKERLERGLAAADSALALAAGVSQDAMLQAMARVEMITNYTQRHIPGGSYDDTISLPDAEISDN